MVLDFWERVNWEYFSPGRVTTILQDNQSTIWNILLEKSESWVDFSTFCQILKLLLKLQSHYDSQDHFYGEEKDFRNWQLYLDVEYGLFYRNLERFGCVEVERRKDQNGMEVLERFRLTPVGVYALRKFLARG